MTCGMSLWNDEDERTMNRIAFALLALAALPAFAPAPFPSSRRARLAPLVASLQGTWRLEKLERATIGGSLDRVTSSTVAVRVVDARWIMLSDNEGEDGTLGFRLDSTKQPVQIDFSIRDDDGSRPYSAGILKLDGDSLTLVWMPVEESSNRPTNFDELERGTYRAVFRKKR